MVELEQSTPLGSTTDYIDQYTPDLLCAIERSDPDTTAPYSRRMKGGDWWLAHELSWLNENGKPVVAQACWWVPLHSPRLTESKSVKLYLNSFANSIFPGGAASVRATLERDLSECVGWPLAVTIAEPVGSRVAAGAGQCLDGLDVTIDQYQYEPGLLQLAAGEPVHESLYTRLFRSLCPVTGQPDWATVGIQYQGRPLDHAGLLRYLVSLRNHQGFHEQVIERITHDIARFGEPHALTVEGRFSSRGGVAIEPVRHYDRRRLK